MTLKLRIEPQQAESLHWTASDALWAAAGAESLQDAIDVLHSRLNPACWEIYQGGHHVAVLWASGASRKLPGIRVAIIEESRAARVRWTVRFTEGGRSTYQGVAKKSDGMAAIARWRQSSNSADDSVALLRNGVQVFPN